jgi:hypothetical protein
LADNFDNMAVVVDWLDACRNQNLDALLDLYAPDAGLECACEGVAISGRAALAAYWTPKLTGLVPKAYGLEEIVPSADSVQLDYMNFEGEPVRVLFRFDQQGKIVHTWCGPAT